MAIKTDPSPQQEVAAAISKRSGPIAIVWHPEKDSQVPVPPIGTNSERPFLFTWVKVPADIDTRRELDQKAFEGGRTRQVQPMQCSELILRIAGLNWIDASLWDEAIAEDKRRSLLEGREGTITRLLREGALKELVPTGDEFSFKGNLAEYSVDDAFEIIKAETNVPKLMTWQKETTEPRLVNKIEARMKELKGER